MNKYSIIKKYPQYNNDIQLFYHDIKQVKKIRIIKIPRKPILDKKEDLPSKYSHFLNVIDLRFLAQLDYFKTGIELGNPEVASTLRGCLETMSCLIYIYDRVKKRFESKEYDLAWDTLYKAVMGRRSITNEFGKSIEEKDSSKKAFHVNDYIKKANQLLKELLESLPSNNKDLDIISFFYDHLCESMHPNYLALESYWQFDESIENISYNKSPRCLRPKDFAMLLKTINQFIPIYFFFIRKAQNLEIQMQTSLVK